MESPSDACLTDDELAALVSGALPAAARDRATAHIERCGLCGELASECLRPVERAELSRGDFVGHYVVLERVGAGAMGVVYAAFDPRLDRRVALKVMRDDDGSRELTGDARLVREARALARCAHRNVVTVHDVGVVDGQIFIAMELIDGRSLDQWLARDGSRPPSWRRTLELLLFAADGLGAAHEAAVIHRDFKPQNVVVASDGRVCVTDFGLATISALTSGAVTSFTRATDATTTAGTPSYMAPELLDGHVADERSDQWAFAVTAWEALSGARPFAASTVGELREAMERGPQWRSAVSVPSGVRTALARAMRVRPQERWPSMGSLRSALERAARPRAWSMVALASAVLAAIVTAGVTTRRHSACPDVDVELASVWSDATKSAIERVFLQRLGSDGAASARDTERAVHAWAARFAQRRAELCRASEVEHTISTRAARSRSQCLERGLSTTRAVLAAIRGGDERALRGAHRAALSLPEVEQCDHAEQRALSLTPMSAAATRAEPALFAALASARATELLGTDADTTAAYQSLSQRARAVGHRSIEARALSVLAVSTSDRATAVRAAALATESGDQEVIADAWLALLRLGARFSNEPDVSLASSMAHVAIASLGEDHRREGFRQRLLCSFYEHRAREFALAHSVCDGALAELRRAPGDQRTVVHDVLAANGMVFMHERRYADAEREFLRSLAIAEQVFGPRNSHFTGSLNNLTEALVALGRYDEAQRNYDRLLSIEPRHSGALDGFAKLLLVRGEPERALSIARRATEVVRGERWDFGEKLTLATELEALCALRRPDEIRATLVRLRALTGEDPSDAIARAAAIEQRLARGGCEPALSRAAPRG